MELIEVKRVGVKDGLEAGLVAGLLFGIAQVVVYATSGRPMLPLRLATSVVLGRPALDLVTSYAVFTIGIFLHAVLSGFFGAIYGALSTWFNRDLRMEYAAQAGLGMVFGAALWVVNIQLIARALFPWFLQASPLAQLFLHVLAYGLPLGFVFASVERREPELPSAEV
jgi:hypothetical protein